jgi:putative glutamine amidotransferase
MTRRSFLTSLSILVAACLGFFVGQNSNVNPTPASSPITEEKSEAPLIGIASLTSETYVLAIKEAGGIPIVLPNGDGSPDKIAEYLELLDGLVMPGGADIPPSEWGEEPHPTTKILDKNRYLFEKALISAWIKKTNKPLLGICLGSQWINVAHGGSLIQDIPSEFGVNHRGVTHQVTLNPSSRLSKIFGETELQVNSLHHQAVGRLGEGLRLVAKSPNGIVEATETTDPHRFLIGVQWHPEKMAQKDPLQAKLLKAFVQASRE